MYNNDEPDYQRIFLAVFLAAMLWVGWQALVEWPRRQALQQANAHLEEQHQEQQATAAKAWSAQTHADAEENPSLTRGERLALSPRVTINSTTLHGSIALRGARFDDITLAQYHETLDKNSPEVTLLSPNGDAASYFAQAGWLAEDGTKVPTDKTLWQADKKTLGAGDTVNLHWDNGDGVTFVLALSLDQDYMFSIAQHVENHSGHAITVMPYAYINRSYADPKSHALWHDGPLGVIDGRLEEVDYKDLRDKGNKVYDADASWIGITDKYWLAALVPSGGHSKTTFSYYAKGGTDRYQVDYLGDKETVASGASHEYDTRLFAGAKVVTILDRYAKGDPAHGVAPIALFDRAVDFGSLYFISKPIFLLLNFFYTHTGNFGIATLLLTIVVRGAMFPLATKSFKATARMRALQPQMQKIRERYVDDQIAMQKEVMALYKREKVNPAAGCLPLLIQMPLFFALYRVLSVTIEMRHAPFFGWIRDLSAADDSNLFTAFGLVNWPAPSWLHIGLLPIVYGITMIIQMRLQPKPADPVQARMMTYMPYIFLFVFAKMPAGLVLYYTCSNTLSIIQQQIIMKQHGISYGNKIPKARKNA